MNPLNNLLESAIIFTDFDFSASAKMSDGNKITGLANDLKLNVTGLKPLFDSQETVETISAKMEGVQQMLYVGMNKFLEQGIDIPLPDYAKKDFKDSMLIPFDHYLLVEADPDVHKYLNNLDEIVSMINLGSEYINQLM